jgi:Xaa-Pro aminopeptidase
MEAEKIDHLLVASEKNFTYLSGYVPPFEGNYMELKDTGEPDVHYAAFPREGTQEPFMVQHDNSVFLERLAPWIKDRRFFGIELGAGMSEYDVEQPIKIVAQAVKDRDLESGSRIGVELDPQFAQARDVMQVQVMQRLKKLLPGTTFVDGSKVIREMRMVKTPYELQKIKKAIAATEKAFRVGFESTRAGMTETDLLKIFRKTLIDEDAQIAHTLVEFFPSKMEYTRGKYFALATETPLHDGDVIGVDMGGAFDCYPSDMIRNKLQGKPASSLAREWVKLYSTVLEANDAVKSSIRPGVTTSELFSVGQRILTSTGLKMMFESVGHSVGLSVHEYPYLNWQDPVTLEPGMVLSIEPAISLKAQSLVIVEDMVRVTDTGCETLSNMPREI